MWQKNFEVISGTTVKPTANVKLKINEKSVEDFGSGNGHIDAAYNIIAKLTGSKSELLTGQ